MAENLGPAHVPPSSSQIYKAQAAAAALKFAMAQEASSEEFTEWSELDVFNPLAMARRFETLETKIRRKRDDESERTDKAEKKEEKHVVAIKFENIAQEFQRRNHELQARTLILLRAMIKETDTKEDVLRKVLEIYSDYTLADEALDYLLETTEGPLAESVREAKEELNRLYGREVRAGRNIAALTTEFATKGLGSPTALRDLYRDVTGNPRDANTLFQQLASTFTFERMQVVIGFLLHSLGADLKAKGPSIPRAELHRLISEGRSLQAILGLYRFFFSRMPLIKNAFSRQELVLPGRLSFDLLARLFVRFLQERYPSGDALLKFANELGVADETAAAIIIYMQMRDAVRQTAPKLFRAEQHRHDVLSAYIDALETLEEKLEEEEEKDEEEKK